MNMRELHEGIGILLMYEPADAAPNCDAQHDELFMGGPEPEKLSAEHRDRLEALSFRWTEYDSWAVFT